MSNQELLSKKIETLEKRLKHYRDIQNQLFVFIDSTIRSYTKRVAKYSEQQGEIIGMLTELGDILSSIYTEQSIIES
ncbi:MAG: hypothetical protein GF317_05905 [Candidatus Lokiarchaeota archaeon]|nr:hypothetical protein [Candidatus Lokiarchaeota archaeon]